MGYIVDSYAWVEYLLGSPKGQEVAKLMAEQNREFITIICCLAEINCWALRNNQNFSQIYNIIRANSSIVDISEHEWIDAGKERHMQREKQPDFGLIDAVLLVKQKALGAKILSGDRHFKDIRNTIFLSNK